MGRTSSSPRCGTRDGRSTGGERFTRAAQGGRTVYHYQDEKTRVELAYRPDGWLAHLVYCDLTRKQNPCTRYTLLEVR